MTEDGGGRRPLRAPRRDDVALLVRIRQHEANALREFTRLVVPLLLDQARLLGVDRAERETVVMGFVDDILLKLAHTPSHVPAPRSLLTFVGTSFRNHVADARRAESVRDRCDEAECELVGGERVVTATCSAFALRAALGPEEAGMQTAVPVAAFINMVMSGCTQEERSLLIWSSQRVPMREIAVWLGISYGAARQRIARLRAQLARESVRQLPNLDPANRVVMTRLLRRAGVKIEAKVEAKLDPDGQTGGAAA